MRFNPSKCNIMRIHRGNSPISKLYELCGTVLQEVHRARYLGVTISNNLGCSTHVDNITKKSSNTLNFLRRNLEYCSKQSKEVAYFATVRSTLEYSSGVWDPHLQNDIDNVERINRRAARFVLGDHRQQSSVSAMMEKLQWSTLEHCRKNQRLTTMFKIVHGLVPLPTTSHISADSRTRCNHQYKFKCILASTTAYRNSIYPKQSPSGTTLTKNLPKRLPSTASRVACISPPSPFVDVIPHIGSLSTMFQIQKDNCSARHQPLHQINSNTYHSDTISEPDVAIWGYYNINSYGDILFPSAHRPPLPQ